MMPDTWFSSWLSDFRGGVSKDCPRYRVVWGPAEHTHLGQQKYLSPNGGILKCWILEKWMPPEFFGSKEEWNKERFFYDDINTKWVDVKGEYPARGAYVMILPLTENGSFIPLSTQLQEEVALRIRANERFANMSASERDYSIRDNHAREELAKEGDLYEADGIRDDYYKTNWGRLNRQGTRSYSIR